MTLFGADAFGGTRQPREIAPGAVHLPGWLPPAEQVRFATAFDDWSDAPVPIRPAMLPGGHRMSVETVCLGWHGGPTVTPAPPTTSTDVGSVRFPNGVDTEAVCDADNCFEPMASLATLDLAELCPMNTAAHCCRLLAQA